MSIDERLFLAQGETTELIARSEGRPLQLKFGSRVALIDTPANAWCVPILNEIRSRPSA